MVNGNHRVDAKSISVRVRRKHIAINRSNPTSTRVLTISTTFSAERNGVLNHRDNVAFRTVRVRSLSDSVTINRVNLTKRRGTIVAINSTRLSILCDPTAGSSVNQHQSRQQNMNPVSDVNTRNRIVLTNQNVHAINHSLLSVSNRKHVSDRKQVSNGKSTTISILPRSNHAIQRRDVGNSIISISNPTRTNVNLTLIFLSRQNRIPHAIIFVLPRIRSQVISIDHVRNLRSFTLLRNVRSFSKVSMSPSNVPFSSSPPLYVSGSQLNRSRLTFRKCVR